MRWSDDAEQLILKVSRSSLESHLSALLGRPVTDVVDFDFQLYLATAPGAGAAARGGVPRHRT